MDPYAILGVDRTASLSDIKKMYQYKLLLTHPDKATKHGEGEQNESNQKPLFTEIQCAWEILRDHEQRRKYDINSDESQLEERPAISQEIDLDDMTFKEDTESFYHSCRCGEGYSITEDELADGIDVVGCSGCSLLVKVLFEENNEPSE